MNKTSPQKGSTTPTKNIAIEFSGVKVKIPIEGLTLDTLEEMIFDIIREIGKKAMVNALAEYDELLRKERPKKLLENISQKCKYLQTRIGTIYYSRRLYKEKETGGARYLLDEALQICKNQRMSLKLSQIICTLASLSSYRGVVQQISNLLGICYSHETIRQNVIKEGLRIESQEEKEFEQVRLLNYNLPEKIPEVLYTETDATYIRKQTRSKKKSSYKKRHFEVKIGMNYTGKESRYKTGKQKSRKLINKNIYIGLRAGRNKFLEKLSYISERKYGVSAVRKSYFGGDGDMWIRAGQKEYFPNAEYLLCQYHLFQRLREAFSKQKKEQKHIEELFKQVKIQEVLKEIKISISKASDEKEAQLLRKYYVYVQNNRIGIESSMQIRNEGLGNNAGAIEPNIDKTIVHRFKHRGMSWSENGASALLKIRQVIFNGEWDNWWYEKRDKKIEIKAVFKKPFSCKQSCGGQDILPYVEATLPCYRGVDQSKPWVKVLRELSREKLL